MIPTPRSSAKPDRAQPVRFRLIAGGFVLIGLYHAAALTIPAFARITYPSTYPPWRHLIFIVLDCAAAQLFLRRPVWLIWLFAAVTVPAIYNHGAHWRQVFAQNNRVDGVDVFIILFLLVTFAALYSERRSRMNDMAESEQ